MKLINHVLDIRKLVQQAMDNRFSKMGIKERGLTPIDALPEDLRQKRQKLEDILRNHQSELEDYAKARQETINECTFTLFNRIAAIKVMEEKELFPEVIKRRPENGNKSFSHNLWLEENPSEKNAERQGLKHFLQSKFNELGENFSLYNENYPYSLMPTADELYNILEAFNAVENDPDCGADIWKGDDILGWLYENFNAVEKEALKNSGEKTEYDKVSLQSQVYTPRWVVKFLVDNTLGKFYLEMFPDSDIVKPDENGEVKYKIANAPTTRKRDPKKMEEIRVLDPACGSGNFLIYTFDLLYDMYLNQMEQYNAEYSRRDIPRLILENNIYGVDLDERAVQLSQIALFIKSRELGGRRARTASHTNVVSTHFFLPDYSEVESEFIASGEWDQTQRGTIRKIWSDLQNAHKFGSLVRVEEVLNGLSLKEDEGTLFATEMEQDLFSFKRRVTDVLHDQVKAYCEKNTSEYALTKAEDAMTFLSILSMPFDVVVANPPYTDCGDFGEELKSFTEENYKKPYKFCTNLYASFIARCCELSDSLGKVGMIHPHTFMYIKTFEDVRKYLLEKTHINTLVDYGLDRVNLFGPGILVDATFYTVDKGVSHGEDSIFFNITSNQQEKTKKNSLERAVDDVLKGIKNDRVFFIQQSKLKLIKSYPFIYWVSDDFREKFTKYNLSKTASVISGLKTGNNDATVRYWWEVNESDKWRFMTKGGPFNRWYGNNWTKVIVENDFELIKQQSSFSIPSTMEVEAITFPSSGSGQISFRLIGPEIIFNNGSPAIVSNDNHLLLAILNSKLSEYSLISLNPTVNTTVGDIQRLPLVDFSKIDKKKRDDIVALVDFNILIKKHLCSFSLIEPHFVESPIGTSRDIKDEIFSYLYYENALNSLVLISEAIINSEVFGLFGLKEEDIHMILQKVGVCIGSLPIREKAKDEFIEWCDNVKAVEVPAIVRKYIEELPEASDIAAPGGFNSLYQTNNGWEDYCVRELLNPVECLCQFKEAGIVPPQRANHLAFELITDIIRTILSNDDDGVVPLNNKLGEDSLALRIEQEFHRRGFNAGQFTQVIQLLGVDLTSYLRSSFFGQLSDYLNLFMYLPKTPFIWHLCSGPMHTLDLFISIYRWDRNTLFRIKSVYAANQESAIRDRINALSNGNSIEQMEVNNLVEQLDELKAFVVKIDDLLAGGYDPKLDDGVAKNIAPLQSKGMISYEVLNASQLKKYLNATW